MKDYSRPLIFATWIFGIIILCIFIANCILYNQPLFNSEHFSAPTYVEVQKVFDVDTGVYYYITSTGDIEVAVDIYGRPLIVDGGDGTAVDPMRKAIPDATQQ